MNEIVFFLEERSAKEMLEGLLPRILPAHIHYRCIPFEGKQDLEKQLPIKLRAWLTPSTCFVVLRDQDKQDWKVVKQRLVDICRQAGKPKTLVRIACSELESWYLGDLAAVETALAIPGLSKKQTKAKFRTPDTLTNAAEELTKLTSRKYQKIGGSRAIGKVINGHIDINKSCSFNTFITGIQSLVTSISSSQSI